MKLFVENHDTNFINPFSVYVKKEVIEEDEFEDTLTYDERKFFYFNADETLPLTGDEIITSPQLIYAVSLAFSWLGLGTD